MASKWLGMRLKSRRMDAGFATAREFAVALGLSENRYARYERGHSEPNIELLLRICRLLDVAPNSLLDYAASDEADSNKSPAFVASRGSQVLARPADFSSSATGLQEGALQTAGTPADAQFNVLMWRLAETYVEAISRPSEGNAAKSRDFPQMKATANLFQKLHGDTLPTIAWILANPLLGNCPECLQRFVQVSSDELLTYILHYQKSGFD